MIKLLLIGTIAFLSVSNATTILHQSFNDLVERADGIVTGTVSEIQYHGKKDSDIFTYITLNDITVENAVYNKKKFTFKMKGGVIDDQYLVVSGTPKFHLNDKVVVFIKDNGKRMIPIVGWGQGVFKIKTNEAQEEYVSDVNGNALHSIDANGHIFKERKYKSNAHIVRDPYTIQQSGITDYGTHAHEHSHTYGLQIGKNTLKKMRKKAFFERLKKVRKAKKKVLKSIAMDNEMARFATLAKGNSVIEDKSLLNPPVIKLPKQPRKEEKNVFDN